MADSEHAQVVGPDHPVEVSDRDHGEEPPAKRSKRSLEDHGERDQKKGDAHVLVAPLPLAEPRSSAGHV